MSTPDRKAFKSRTVWYGIVMMVLGVLQSFADQLPIRPIYQGAFAVIMGILIIVIRFDTTGSIDDKS